MPTLLALFSSYLRPEGLCTHANTHTTACRNTVNAMQLNNPLSDPVIARNNESTPLSLKINTAIVHHLALIF